MLQHILGCKTRCGKRQERECTHKSPSSTCAVDNQIGHVTNQVSCQSEIEKHVENIKDHLPLVHRMQVAVSDSCQSCDRPIYCCHIPNPQALLKEVIHGCSNPSPLGVMVTRSNKIIEASSTVNGKKGNLQKTSNP